MEEQTTGQAPDPVGGTWNAASVEKGAMKPSTAGSLRKTKKPAPALGKVSLNDVRRGQTVVVVRYGHHV